MAYEATFEGMTAKDIQAGVLRMGVVSIVAENPVIVFKKLSTDATWRLYPEESQLIFKITSGEKRNIYIENTSSGGEGLCIGASSGADESAALEVVSTTLGFLPPRMTTTQRDAISSPATGLMIYNTTTNKLNVYTGSGWEAITSA